MKKFEVKNIKDWALFIKEHENIFTSKTIVLLEGELAAGKTTFVSEVCKYFGFQMSSSPTFALIQIYIMTDQNNNQNQPRENFQNSQSGLNHKMPAQITHVDLYRTESEAEIESSGFWDVFQKSDQIVFVEWSSRVANEHWPLDWNIFRIKINVLANLREVEVEKIN